MDFLQIKITKTSGGAKNLAHNLQFLINFLDYLTFYQHTRTDYTGSITKLGRYNFNCFTGKDILPAKDYGDLLMCKHYNEEILEEI